MKLELSNLAKGIANMIKDKMGVADEATLLLSKERQNICKSCESLYHNKLVNADMCNVCDCVIVLKTFSDSKCPKNKW